VKTVEVTDRDKLSRQIIDVGILSRWLI